MPEFNTRDQFPEFYAHPFIMAIKDNSRWTVSGILNPDDKKSTNKAPIDIWMLHDEQKIIGAQRNDSTCLMTLQQLTDFIPNAANHAYYLKALEDEYLILDIEKDCPDNLKQQFLSMNYVYGETSMSGQGYHLVFPVPIQIDKYPAAKSKKVWKENKYYELHLEHYVTFTRNMLPPASGSTPFLPFFEKLAKHQTETIKGDATFKTIDLSHIPYSRLILTTAEHYPPYEKTTEDFNNDMSKWEFGCIGHILGHLRTTLNGISKRHQREYTNDEIAALLCEIAKSKIPHRPKHDETRRFDNKQVPFLQYQVYSLLSMNLARKKKRTG